MFKNYRYYVLFMLFSASFINYVDRSALSIAAPMITKEFNLGPADLGLILSSFFIGYALFNFVGGYLSDVYGPRKIFGIAMILWSIFGGLTGVATGYISLFIYRVLFGIGEGPIGSGSNKTVNNWFPDKERARAMGMAIAAMPLGAALTGPIVGFLALSFGWRTPFFVLMVLGLIWSYFWLKNVTDFPNQNKRVREDELLEIEKGQTIVQGAKKLPISFYIKQPTILAIAVSFFACNYVLYFFLTWFPTYLVDAHGLSLKNMSIVTVIPWIVGMLGQVSGGFISDFIYKKTGKLMFSRKVVLVPCLLGMAVTLGLGGLAVTTTSAVILMTLGIVFQYLIVANLWAMVQDTVPNQNVGGVSGMVHFLSNLSGIIGPAATGFIVQFTHSYTTAFVIASIVSIIGGLGIAFLAKPLHINLQNSNEAVM